MIFLKYSIDKEKTNSWFEFSFYLIVYYFETAVMNAYFKVILRLKGLQILFKNDYFSTFT